MDKKENSIEQRKLTECPFCHSNNLRREDDSHGAYWIDCECGCSGPIAYTPEEADELWCNRKARDDDTF